ncbi:MAG: cytochrome C [Pseudonocardiales bacterium]|nr:MAG: cytochrome C [Pseudonocardiales bacterium]
MTHVHDGLDDDSSTGKGEFVQDDIDIDVDGELGFEPAVSVTGAEPSGRPAGRSRTAPAASKPGSRRVLRRRLGAGAVLIGALVSMGGTYAAFASSSAPDTSNSAGDIAAGRQLYQTSCITCHGANLQGVKDRAPSLLGVGGASVYFQVSTGRMPAAGQGADQKRKTAKFDEQQVKQLAAYIQSIGGGPQLPVGDLRAGDIAKGGDLFRLNCASCHGTTFQGAPLSAGKVAPGLNRATDEQFYAAMLSGPESMPIFSDHQLTPLQKREIINYVQTLKASKDPGGNGIDRIGPVSEALVFFIAGVGAVMAAILWIGAKAE